MVTNTRALDAGREIVSEFVLIGAGWFASEEGSDVVGLL